MASVVRMKRGVLIRSPADIECDTGTTSGIIISATVRARATAVVRAVFADASEHVLEEVEVWLDRATIQFRVLRPSSFNTALQLVLRPHFLVHFV
jgi:hypothetical protein